MDKNYKHKTTGQECNAAQYIAEMVCLRKAEREKVVIRAFERKLISYKRKPRQWYC